jgi:hypothetical protein
MLKAFYTALVAKVGEQHVMTHQYKCFMDDLEKQESFYADRIEKCDPILSSKATTFRTTSCQSLVP